MPRATSASSPNATCSSSRTRRSTCRPGSKTRGAGPEEGRRVSRLVFRFNEIDWQLPDSPGADADAVEAAAALGVARKHLAQGEAGFYAQIVRFPADFETPSHSHD